MSCTSTSICTTSKGCGPVQTVRSTKHNRQSRSLARAAFSYSSQAERFERFLVCDESVIGIVLLPFCPNRCLELQMRDSDHPHDKPFFEVEQLVKVKSELMETTVKTRLLPDISAARPEDEASRA